MSEESRPSEVLVPDTPEPPTFDEAVRAGVQRLQEAVSEFEALAGRIPEEAYRPGEAQVLEATAAELERLVEAGQIDFDSAAYDGEAWYAIVEDLQRVANKLYDAIILMRDVEKRADLETPSAEPHSGTETSGTGATVL